MNLNFIILLFSSVASSYLHFSRPNREPILGRNDQHQLNNIHKYPLSRYYYERYLMRLNSKNITIQNHEILNGDPFESDEEVQETVDLISKILDNFNETDPKTEQPTKRVRIILNKNMFENLSLGQLFPTSEADEDNENPDNEEIKLDPYGNRIRTYGRNGKTTNGATRSENFEVIKKSPLSFKDIGGYDKIKLELNQCIDILTNYSKYTPYNVRVPKGLIFEGPPGNGKTLMAKALAGEAKCSFIPVSGAEFQEKYVGVGSSKIRELFKLAKNHIPCIIFIDEIDALGRSRGKDGESSSAERDNTLNELLISLDGFKNSTGIFVIGATNRADLLDSALLRPGRIDKRIFIGNPDVKTRRAIIKIHGIGKPRSNEITDEDLVDITSGFSGAQIENLLNEAMLNALRDNREIFIKEDLDIVLNKILVGWQPTEHAFSTNIIDHIAIHEMGHAIVGLLCKHHSNVTKVIINLSAPNSPGYTVFENPNSNIYTREALFEHLMILLAGRIAEEVFYGISVTTGAINDFEEALKLANKMVVYYGMGELVIYPNGSEKYKEMIDNEIIRLIEDAYGYAEFIIRNSKEFIGESAELLKEQKMIRAEELFHMIETKYKDVLDLKLNE